MSELLEDSTERSLLAHAQLVIAVFQPRGVTNIADSSVFSRISTTNTDVQTQRSWIQKEHLGYPTSQIKCKIWRNTGSVYGYPRRLAPGLRAFASAYG